MIQDEWHGKCFLMNAMEEIVEITDEDKKNMSESDFGRMVLEEDE